MNRKFPILFALTALPWAGPVLHASTKDNPAPGETCWKLEQKWFWKEGFRAGNAQGALGHMATAHSRNSNFLLNVGPDKKGRIVESSVKTLAEIGKLLSRKVPPDLPK